MSGKLDQSLDDILKTRRKAPRRNTRARAAGKVATTGGVTKKPAKAVVIPAKSVPAVVAARGTGGSKIIVTGLPADVSEQQIKDYFSKTIGPVKKVFLTYGPNGESKGIATIIFNQPGSAQEAATQLNGVKVDNRAMRIEVVLGANQTSAVVPIKALGERIAPGKKTATAAAAATAKTKTKTKNQPKSAAATANNAKTGGGRAGKRTVRGRNAARAKPKSAAELDAEMTDYFGSGTAANGAAPAVNGAAAATGGDAGMEDEIM